MSNIQAAADVFNKHALLYQEKFMDISLYHDTLDLFCDYITKQEASILEVACGPGNITSYVLQQRPDFAMLCTDLAPNMIELAKKNNPGVEVRLMDAKDTGKLGAMYDGIICGFGLPYLSKEDSIRFIADASRLLQAGGVLYLSTMEGDYSKSGVQKSSKGDEVYMYYHEAGYLVQALEDNGFDKITVMNKDYKNDDGTKTNDLVLVAVKGS